MKRQTMNRTRREEAKGSLTLSHSRTFAMDSVETAFEFTVSLAFSCLSLFLVSTENFAVTLLEHVFPSLSLFLIPPSLRSLFSFFLLSNFSMLVSVFGSCSVLSFRFLIFIQSTCLLLLFPLFPFPLFSLSNFLLLFDFLPFVVIFSFPFSPIPLFIFSPWCVANFFFFSCPCSVSLAFCPQFPSSLLSTISVCFMSHVYVAFTLLSKALHGTCCRPWNVLFQESTPLSARSNEWMKDKKSIAF